MQGVSGSLILSGNNSYTGVTDIKGGQIDAISSNALGASGAGNETRFENFGELSVGGVGTLMAETIDQVTLFVDNNSTVTLSGPVSIRSSLHVGSNSTLIIAGGLASVPGSRLTFGGTDSSSNLVFSSTAINTYTGTIATVNSLRMRVDGQIPGPVNIAQGTLSGTGTVGSVIVGGISTLPPQPVGPLSFALTADSATLNPAGVGTVGTLTTGDFYLYTAGRMTMEVAPGGTDRISVHGTVQLIGFLDAQVLAGFVLSIGGHYRLIDNDGTDAVLGTFRGLPEGAVARTVGHVSLRVTYRGGDGNDVELVGETEKPAFAVAAGDGGGPHVKVFGGNGTLLRQFFAYDANFHGGVHVATGDVTGDGIPDIVTAPGVGGGPDIRVWDGASGAMIREFNAYDPNFRGGAWIAVGDVNGDGRADIVTGAGKGGGPHVKAFSGVDGSGIGQFLAYNSAFTGGVTVAVFFGKIVTGPGVGGGPDVRIFTADGTMTDEFDAFDNTFRGGIFVSTGGSTNGATNDYLLIGPGAGRAPSVIMSFIGIDSHGLPQRQTFPYLLAYDAQFVGGVRVADLTSKVGTYRESSAIRRQWCLASWPSTRHFLAACLWASRQRIRRR
jgi:autotransporter-associated beta strand protein